MPNEKLRPYPISDKAQEIMRLQREIAVLQSRLVCLMCGGQHEGVTSQLIGYGSITIKDEIFAITIKDEIFGTGEEA